MTQDKQELPKVTHASRSPSDTPIAPVPGPLLQHPRGARDEHFLLHYRSATSHPPTPP